MIYYVNEMFYSLKGEGLFTGVPMAFIRFSGCNLSCDFCDTKHEDAMRLPPEEIVERIKEFPARRVVLTGGEPLYAKDLEPLLTALDANNYKVHLETNGMLDIPDFAFSWITVSPKNSDLSFKTMRYANEIKFLCGQPHWQEIIFEVTFKYKTYRKRHLLIMPLAKGKRDKDFTRDENAVIDENVQEAMKFCLRFPQFRYCTQLHKQLRIK